MLARALQVALAFGVLAAVAFGGGVALVNPLGFLLFALVPVTIALAVAVLALLGAFIAVWLCDRRLVAPRGVRVLLATLGAGIVVTAAAVIVPLLEEGAGRQDWSGAYLSLGLFCAVVATVCAGFMASFVEFPRENGAGTDAGAEDGGVVPNS